MPERIVLDQERSAELRQQHIARYEFATQYVKGKLVLDIACGTGYGAAILAESGAARVIGIDHSEEALFYARKHYGTHGIEFMRVDLESVETFPNADVIVSFETIEHLMNPSQFLRKAQSALKAVGVILISTPIRGDHLRGRKSKNPFHIHEWSVEEFSSLLHCFFDRVELYFQHNFKKRRFPFSRTLAKSLTQLVSPVVAREILRYPVRKEPPQMKEVGLDPQYIIAVCHK